MYSSSTPAQVIWAWDTIPRSRVCIPGYHRKRQSWVEKAKGTLTELMAWESWWVLPGCTWDGKGTCVKTCQKETRELQHMGGEAMCTLANASDGCLIKTLSFIRKKKKTSVIILLIVRDISCRCLFFFVKFPFMFYQCCKVAIVSCYEPKD